MTAVPLVSIILPLHNDEEHVAAALDSCIRQTSGDFEVVCVDDASTDSTAAVVKEYAGRDARIRLIEQPENASAFQARRVGITSARGQFILFLDGDDELAPEAVAVSSRMAERTGADVVGIGVEIVADGDSFPARFQAALQPRFPRLEAPDIIPALFPPGKPANGHLWRHLYRRHLLESAYAGMPVDAKFYRANDLPIAFLAIARADSYVSTTQRLYRYHFRRGTSGHAIEDVAHFDFLASGLTPFAAAEGEVARVAASGADPTALLDSYQSARRYLVGSLLRWCHDIKDAELQRICLERLAAEVDDASLIEAAASFAAESLPLLTSRASGIPLPRRAVSHLLLTTAHLGTGGLQGVLIAHAAALRSHGYNVTVAVMREVDNEMELPQGVSRVLIGGKDLSERLNAWRTTCVDLEIDAIIDHHILYNESWPWLALIARAEGIPTYGWLHNFALRPVFDGSSKIGYLSSHLGILERVVTLSPTDVAFWKMRGIENVVYLPNPLSRLAEEALQSAHGREHVAGPIELVWWGRFDPTTKQVLHLLEVAEQLRQRGVDFTLTLIGPDSAALSERAVLDYARRRNVQDHVRLLGDQTPGELLAALSRAHIMVLTSAIEGSPLTLMEAQALGLPVVMYELPWILSTNESPAILTVPQDDRAAIAAIISDLSADSERYAAASAAAISYARQVAHVDVGRLVVDLVEDRLDAGYAPQPSVEDAKLLLAWMVRFSERNARFMRRTREARRQGDRAQRKLREIESGMSFRIGRMVTFLPRRALRLLAARKSR